jgi:DNA invertase Pin-like site-specific DNA recombinase
MEGPKLRVINEMKKEGNYIMKYGYVRISSLHQNLEAQLQALKKEGCDKIYADKFTGTKTDRPEFNKLLDVLKEGDTLVFTKLDRFARTTADGINTIKSLFEKGIKVHVLNMGLIEDTPTGKLILSVMLAFAEFERDLIVERTQEGKAIAKQKPDFREGGPKKFSKKQINHALKLLETHSYKQVTEMTGISKSTLIRAKREREQKILD